jgi:hypothetical protein
MNKALLRRFEEESAKVYGAAGWRKRNRKTFTREIAPGIDAQVRLEPSALVQLIWITAYVSIRHNELERVVSQLKGERPHPYDPATVGWPLTSLISRSGGDGKEALFYVDDHNVEHMARRTLELTARYGRPLWETHTTIHAIAEALDAPEWVSLPGAGRYARPVAWYLAGDIDRARRIVGEVLEGLDPERDWVDGPKYPGFAERFFALIDQRASHE